MIQAIGIQGYLRMEGSVQSGTGSAGEKKSFLQIMFVNLDTVPGQRDSRDGFGGGRRGGG